MLEFPSIQQRGFRNVTAGGKVTGFQVAVRSTNYRGLWLSQLRAATVTVDGEQFGEEQVTWTVAGKTVEQADLARHGDIHWGTTEPAILTVRKPGGLAPGIHEVGVRFANSSSYLPPRIDLHEQGGEPRRIVLVR